jgi:hypothetical protein
MDTATGSETSRPSQTTAGDLPAEAGAPLQLGGESSFAWEWRTLAVAAVWAVPGLLFGVLVRVFVPDGGPVAWWMAGGSVLGATFGGLLEADHLSL